MTAGMVEKFGRLVPADAKCSCRELVLDFKRKLVMHPRSDCPYYGLVDMGPECIKMLRG